MLDIGITKLAVIGAVALVVIGPERLPTVARMVGSLYGRMQRYINDVKSEVSRDMELDELRKMKEDVEEAAASMQHGLHEQVSGMESELNSAIKIDDDSAVSAEDDAHSIADPEVVRRKVQEEDLKEKVKSFQKKRLARTTSFALRDSFRYQRRTRVISASGRVAKYRKPAEHSSSHFF